MDLMNKVVVGIKEARKNLSCLNVVVRKYFSTENSRLAPPEELDSLLTGPALVKTGFKLLAGLA